MSDTRKKLVDEIDGMRSIGEFITASEEIAANNMRRIRDAVVKRRDFIKELTDLYNEIKTTYEREMILIKSSFKKKKDMKVNFFKKNGKTASVFLSTNTTLYGDVLQNTYKVFKEHLEREKTDVVIVGKMGRQIFEMDFPGKEYQYFDFPDSIIDHEFLKPIVLGILEYEKVIIFHSKFQTLLSQIPTAYVIAENEESIQNSKPQRKYIFEPSLDKIVEYFEKEIFSSIFEQTMHESHLSKFASRMVTLDGASESIKKKLSDLSFKQRQLQHQIINKAQLNSLTRLSLWKRA